MDAVRIERRVGPVLKGIVLATLLAFVVAAGFALVAAWRSVVVGWIVGWALGAGFFLVVLLLFIQRYLVRGVGGHYLVLVDDALELGEIGGRVLHRVACEDIASIHYDHGNEFSTRVELRHGNAFTLREIDLHEEEFDQLAGRLSEAAPAIRIDRA